MRALTAAITLLGGTMMMLAAGALAQSATTQSPADSFRALADQYFEQAYFKYSPTAGTLSGFHQYDTKLEDYSRAALDAEAASLHEFEKKFAQVEPAQLDITTQGDLNLVLSAIRAQLLSIQTIRMWEKNPDNYSGGITNSIFSLMERKFAPADERLASVVAREKQIPAVFAAARQNLKNPPHIYTEIALQQIPDIIGFFQNDVPEAFKDATDPAIKADFERSNGGVITALQQYGEWMRTDLLPRSKGDFKIGADAFAKKLRYDEMVDTPLDKLLEIGHADLHRNRAEFDRIAKEVDPGKTPREVLADPRRCSPASRPVAAIVSRPVRRTHPVHPREEDRDHPLRGSTDA